MIRHPVGRGEETKALQVQRYQVSFYVHVISAVQIVHHSSAVGPISQVLR